MPSPRSDITALRLSAQRIAAPGDLQTPLDVARWMLALQSQDFPGARWAIGLRLPHATARDVDDALAAGTIVRSWPMRGTLHIVAAEDLGWMMSIAARRQATWAAKRRGDLEITDDQLVRAGDIAVGELTGGRIIRRDALLAAWEAAGIPTTGQRGYHLLWNLAHQKLIVFGPHDAKQPTFTSATASFAGSMASTLGGQIGAAFGPVGSAIGSAAASSAGAIIGASAGACVRSAYTSVSGVMVSGPRVRS